MTVTAPKGFLANGIHAGIKPAGRFDMAAVVNTGPSRVAAAVYTSNRAKANPILWSQAAMAATHSAEAIILNSGGANCFTGPFGFETTRLTAQAAADSLGVEPDNIQVCSTGMIGVGGMEFRQTVVEGTTSILKSVSEDGGMAAAEAIMTTDTVPKTATYSSGGWTIGGMAKGAGMLAPGLATMLVVLTTDAVLAADQADAALRESTRVSFDRLDSDGCMSTNDQVTLMVSGASSVEPIFDGFVEGLKTVCLDLAMQLLSDAEGASHEIAITVVGAEHENDALEVGRTVARNNLFKAAIFGNDPNWGRVLAAIGTTRAEFDPYNVEVFINDIRVCAHGQPDRPRTEVDLTPRATSLVINLQAGTAEATIWTNDLTHDYVHENSVYSS